ncbi:MAG: hypothetical protein ACC652_07765 [Acidimicrobiales bacterium]
MSGSSESDLQWLEDLVADAVRSEYPLPVELVDAAAGLFDFVHFEASVAELVESELSVRSPGTRSRTFTWDNGYEIILETVPGSEQSQLTGVVSATGLDEIVIRSRGGNVESVVLLADTFEFVTSDRLLRIEMFDASFVTPWFRV